VLLVAAAVLGLATAAAPALGGPAPVGGTRGPVGHDAVAATGSTARVNLGGAGWKVQTSSTATQPGAQISTPGFSTSGWLAVTNDDGGAPGTEINALLQNGSCPNVFFSTNMKSCFGQMTKIGPDTIAQFSVPWWYRTDFTAPAAGQSARLILNGVVGTADVWVDGVQIVSGVSGAYAQNSYDITNRLAAGTNSLAIEMHPNDPTKMLTVDNVDWSQIPPDNNTGIQFPVQLQTGGPLVLADAHVVQNTAANLSSSALTVKASVTNGSSTAQAGTAAATITPPGGASPITVSQTVSVAANSTQTITFAPASYPALTLSNPQIWWPYQLGAQPLYTLDTSVSQGSTTLNSTTGRFGIRTATSKLIGSSTGAPQGVRQFAIDGVPLDIRGGGWDPDLFLRYSAADTAKQIGLFKAMGLNTIRLEGHLMPEDWYQQMDAAGILVNAGYQCCDYWEGSSAGAVYQNTAQSVGAVLRNHPSVFSFQWSDNAPSSAQESQALAGFAAADFAVPFISSAEYNSSPQLGTSGEKEGPYDWVPPSYWYDTSHYASGDSTQTNAGGSWGFDSEQSAGNTVPTLDSINRFLSAADQTALWQTPGANQYHNNYEGTSHTGYHFGTLYNLDQAITNRYGAPTSLGQYVQEAQAQNYEDTRAQFEAFIDHWNNASQPSTGTIYWQMNKGWPTLLWSLYNNDGDQAGAYFGAQKANQSLHALYALDDGTVTLDNLSGTTQSGVSLEAKVYDTSGALLDDQTSSATTLARQQVVTKVLTPKRPTASGTVYFVELLVKQNDVLVDRNVYWQPTTGDAINWSSTIGKPQGVMTSYANLTALRNLPQNSAVSVTAKTVDRPGPNGADKAVTVTVTNNASTPTVGFFLRADIRRGTASGQESPGDNELQSSIWSDNDVTLWPGESETLTASYNSADLRGATPVVSVSGWNMPKVDVVAGTGTGGGPGNDFSIADNPASGSVAAGSAATATVSTSVVSGSAESVALTASGLPAGATATVDPASVTAGGSSTLTISTSASTPAGNYPVIITGTSASATHQAIYALTVTGSGGGSNAVVNGDFETGDLSGWTVASGTASAVTTPVHSGGHAGLVGATTETSGTSKLQQTFTAPAGSSKLTLAYDVFCTDSTGGFATAFLLDNTASTTTRVINRSCTNGSGWQTATTAITPGHSYTIQLESRDDGVSGTPTHTVYDDITVN
jgi:exo-1,4-beta-D-glucosaminidase